MSVLYFLLRQRKVSLWLRRAIARRAGLLQGFIQFQEHHTVA